MKDDEVLPANTATVIIGVSDGRFGRDLVWGFLKTKWDLIVKKIGSNRAISLLLVGLVLDIMFKIWILC